MDRVLARVVSLDRVRDDTVLMPRCASLPQITITVSSDDDDSRGEESSGDSSNNDDDSSDDGCSGACADCLERSRRMLDKLENALDHVERLKHEIRIAMQRAQRYERIVQLLNVQVQRCAMDNSACG